MTINTQLRQVICGDRTIEYLLTRKKVKNINLRIKPEGKVYVSASQRASAAYIDDFIREKQAYILDALDRYHFIHPNHSRQFHDFVTMLMPDWKERKRVLEDA